MHKLNQVPLSSHPHLDSNIYGIDIYYQSKTTGDITTDIDDAVLDFDGNPLVIELKSTTKVDSSISNPPKPLSFSPSDPISRLQCFEVFGLLNKKPSSPLSMIDKMEAHGYAERVSHAISDSIQNAVRSVNSTSVSSNNSSNSSNSSENE